MGNAILTNVRCALDLRVDAAAEREQGVRSPKDGARTHQPVQQAEARQRSAIKVHAGMASFCLASIKRRAVFLLNG